MILDPIICSSSPFKVNILLVQDEDFDLKITKFTNLSRRERCDFSDYTAKLEVFDEIRPKTKYLELSTEDNIKLYDGEIQISITADMIAPFYFDTAKYQLVLTNNLGKSKVFMKGTVYLELGTRLVCQKE